ncbi:Rho GTPase-activating protein 42 [Pelomyxa schiedti]|nr:Rho GTPase-activating protein 42 [Pelomyxa schiedti]
MSVRPEVVGAVCDVLSTSASCEGLFRVSGGRVVVERIGTAIHATTSTDQSSVARAIRTAAGAELSPHDVTSAFKQYLKALDEPVIPPAKVKSFKDALAQVRNGSLGALTAAVTGLPANNRAALQILVRFLVKVSDESRSNMMDANNLGVVIGPSLFREEDPASAATSMQQHADIVTTLILHFPDIFESNPDDWMECADKSGRAFYCHKIGNYTQWDLPKALKKSKKPAEEQPLPPDWKAITDPEGRKLFINTTTGATQWTAPTPTTTTTSTSTAPQKPLPQPKPTPTPPPKTVPTPPPKTVPNPPPKSTEAPPPAEETRHVSPPPRATSPPVSSPSTSSARKSASSQPPIIIQPAQPTPAVPATPKPVKISGWMFKDAGGTFKGWQRRWFDLDPDKKSLTYSKTSDSTSPQGVISLSQADVTNDIAPGREFSFTLRTPGRDFHLQASSMADQQAWVAALKAALTKS